MCVCVFWLLSVFGATVSKYLLVIRLKNSIKYVLTWFRFPINVTVHDKTRYKSIITILDNAHLKVQTLCYFLLKSDRPNEDKITYV